MNEPKIVPLIIYNNDNYKEKKEESYEEYQIIKEDYCSSPKCGIRSKIVTKSVEKMSFSPIEISTNPYFKYCVIPIKDENFKYDFSQSETNHTRNQEEKNQKKNNKNNSNNQKISFIDINEFKEENTENENDIQIEEENETKYIIEKKESDINVIFNDNNKDDVIKDSKKNIIKLKDKKVALHKGKKLKSNSVVNHPNTTNKKEKEKMNLNDSCDDANIIIKKKPKLKTSQRTMHNILILNDETTNNKGNKIESNNCILPKNSIAFQSIKLKKNKNKNSISPFVVNKDKEEPIKVISSYTTTNINRLKKKKKIKDSKIIRTKTININNLQPKPVYNSDNKNKKRSYDIIEEKNKKNNSNKNIYAFSKSQKRAKRYKIKGIGEKTQILKNDTNNNKSSSQVKDNNDMFIARGVNHFLSYKINIDDKYTKELFEKPATAGRRRATINNDFKFEDIKPKNILLEVKKEKEKEKNNMINKKKDKRKLTCNSEFILEKDKDKDKDKDKNKEKDKVKETFKIKEKDNDNNIKKIKSREKKERKKSKKKEKSTQKLKGKIKDLINEKKVKNKYSAKNLKLLFKDLKQKNSESKQKNNGNVNNDRRGRSHTIFFKNNRSNTNFLRNTSTKKLSTFQVTQFSNKINNTLKENLMIKRAESREINNKNNNDLNLDATQDNFPRLSRRYSTRILFHNNKSTQQEKITAYTNKQTINNLNDYIRRCLEVIPDLYALEEIPRCKTKIHPSLDQNKKTNKIALFDLDETIVHCIGEINMNNVENFSRQCDAKLKVQLPGGKEVTIGINIRPHWKEALDIIKDKYHIIAYTASHESYADSVLNYLDPDKKYFEYRLYRSHCVLCFVDEMKFYVKDLDILNNFCDLKDAVLIDNSVLSFAYHLDNGIPISPFYDSKNDCELLDISNFLLKYADEDDIRVKLREFYKLGEYLEIVKNNVSDDSYTNSSSISISVVKEDEEGERTAKNSYGNKKGMNYNSNNSTKNSPIIEEKNSTNNNNIEEQHNNSISKGKNSSQLNLQYKDIIKTFERIKDEKKRCKSFSFKQNNNVLFDSRKLLDLMKSRKNSVTVKNYVKKKKKFKSVRYFDINFRKEWNEKQKELKDK